MKDNGSPRRLEFHPPWRFGHDQMPIPWGNRLGLARWVALIEEDDLREAIIATDRWLIHLQRDLVLEAVRVG